MNCVLNEPLVLDPNYLVYGIKSVSAIPLNEALARAAVKSIGTRYKTASMFHFDDPSEIIDPPDNGAKVKFSDNNAVKVMTPRDAEFDMSKQSPVSSGSTTPVSDGDTVAPLAKVLASRLSFWNRSSRRLSSLSAPDERDALRDNLHDKLQDSDEEPEQVVKDFVEASGQPPASESERQRELDDKVLKGCIREFTKGEMYFAYDFG